MAIAPPQDGWNLRAPDSVAVAKGTQKQALVRRLWAWQTATDSIPVLQMGQAPQGSHPVPVTVGPQAQE